MNTLTQQTKLNKPAPTPRRTQGTDLCRGHRIYEREDLLLAQQWIVRNDFPLLGVLQRLNFIATT
jgi:hypothetical protein